MRRRVRSFLPLAAALAPIVSCGVESEPSAILEWVSPPSAYSDGATLLSMHGGPFRPAVGVDTMSGAAQIGPTPFTVFLTPSPAPGIDRSIPLTDPLWQSSVQIDADLLPGLPAGDYSVQMRDPRGQAVPSTAQFTSLGPDIDAPVITFQQPPSGMAVGGGTLVTVSVRVEDGPGHLRAIQWSASSPALGEALGDCMVAREQPAVVECTFTFTAPPVTVNLAQIDIRVDAQDSVQNSSSAVLPIRVAWRPTLNRLMPAVGPSTGGTDIFVAGTGFIDNLSEILIDGVSIHGVVEGDAIHGVTAPHFPGMAAVTVTNGNAGSQPLVFTFMGAVKVRAVSPTHGPAGQSTAVTVAGNHFSANTTFSWSQNNGPPQPISQVDYQGESLVIVTLPPGTGVISILAHDPDAGDSELPNAFTYDDTIP